MSNLFDSKNIKPMLIGANGEPFDNSNFIFELKWDGERCLAYLDPKSDTELRNKRNIKMLPKVPELSQIHKQVKKKCILDGELMIMKNGKPDFFEIKRRSLTSNKFKIELASKQYPASFVAYDILFYDNKDTMSLSLMERKALLDKVLKENERIALSRYINGKGIDFYNLAKQQELEGIVAKRKDSIYIPDKRTKDWIKIKYMMDDDFVVCGYIIKDKGITSIVLGQFENGTLIYQGHVTMGVNGKDFETIAKHPRAIRPPVDAPAGHGNEDAIWISPDLVCVVEFMHRTPSGGMRQPVFKGLRSDKLPRDCKIIKG